MLRFDGSITGLGTSSGVRLVLGVWPNSPFGPIADAMIERPDGHRLLLAPTAEVGEFIAGTYRFDEVRVEPTALHMRLDVPLRTFSSPSLQVELRLGGRTPVGRLLALVPAPLARSRRWVRTIDPVARVVRRGVRTNGSAGAGRREWYCALDEHRVVALSGTLDGVGLGGLAPVVPAVRFGFASTPATPSCVRVTTWVSGSTASGPVTPRTRCGSGDDAATGSSPR